MTLEEIQYGQILLVDKPLDWSSFNVVNKIKFKLKREFKLKKIKVGHAGTLDPRATGLLIVCTGKATKQISEIQDAPKEYFVEIKLGVQTESYDTEKPEILHQDISHITGENVQEILQKFIGEGERAYNLARAGVQVEMKNRKITIYYIDNVEIEFPFVRFSVGCSKGTYIRTLAHDIGQKLGVGAYLTTLRRTKIGNFSVENSTDKYLQNDFLFDEDI